MYLSAVLNGSIEYPSDTKLDVDLQNSLQEQLKEDIRRSFVDFAAVLDIAEEILKHERGEAPSHRKQVISTLKVEGLISPKLAERLRDAVEFRDVLSHTYGPVVNDDLVYGALQNSLGQFEDFVNAVDEYQSD